MKKSVKLDEDLLNMARKEAHRKKQNITTVLEEALEEKLTGGLLGRLKCDPDLFMSWQANIAMAMKDEFARYRKKIGKRSVSYSDMHVIANKAAEDFLNLLIK